MCYATTLSFSKFNSLASVIDEWMSVCCLWNGAERAKPRYSEENLSKYHFIHQKSQFWTNVESISILRGGRPVTNLRSHNTVRGCSDISSEGWQEEVQERGYGMSCGAKTSSLRQSCLYSCIADSFRKSFFVFLSSYAHFTVIFIPIWAKTCICARIETRVTLPYYRKWLSNKQLYFVVMIIVLWTHVWCLFMVRLSAFRSANVDVCLYVPCTMLPLLCILLSFVPLFSHKKIKCSITVHCDFNCTAQWSLYVPSCLTFGNSTFCPHRVFMCFEWTSEQTAIISLYNINWLVFVTEMKSVYCAVRTGSLNIIQV